MQSQEVAITSVAEAMLEQLPVEERRLVLASVEEVSRTFSADALRKVEQSNGQKPFYILRVSPKIRVFISHNDDDHSVVILDVLTKSIRPSEQGRINSASESDVVG